MFVINGNAAIRIVKRMGFFFIVETLYIFTLRNNNNVVFFYITYNRE